MRWISIGFLSVVLILYLLVGGAIFMVLEKHHEDMVTTTQQNVFQKFLNDNICVSADELKLFAEAAMAAYDAGVTATTETSVSNWEYGPAVFFTITVVTSIGYGKISPVTEEGRIFFAFYAIFGIPCCAVLLAGLGEKMARPYKKLDKRTFFSNHPTIEKIVKILLFNVVCFILFSIIPAFMFMRAEDWTFLQAWYYTVVTLTTVGFGDLVPAQTEESGHGMRAFYKIVVGVWIFFGLAWLSMQLNLIGDIIKSQTNKVNADNYDKVSEKRENASGVEKNVCTCNHATTSFSEAELPP